MEPMESQIAEWRAFVGRGPAVDGRDVEELEAHLRDQIADLDAAGLPLLHGLIHPAVAEP